MRKFIEVEKNVKICYEYSKKSDSYIIFLHGRAGNVTAYDPVRIFLEERGYATLAIDMRGHGLSSRPRRIQDYEFKKYVQDVLDIIKKEKIKNAFIFGHSFGAMIALLLAKETNPAIKCVFLAGLPVQMPKWVFKIANQKWFFDRFHRWLENAESGITDRRYVYSFKKYTGDTDQRRNLMTMRYSGLRSWFFIQHHMNKWHAKDHLKKIKKKVVFFAGKYDAFYPTRVFKKMHLATKNSELEIAKTGHSPVIQTPILVSKTVLKYLEKIKFKKTLPIKIEDKWKKILDR